MAVLPPGLLDSGSMPRVVHGCWLSVHPSPLFEGQCHILWCKVHPVILSIEADKVKHTLYYTSPIITAGSLEVNLRVTKHLGQAGYNFS